MDANEHEFSGEGRLSIFERIGVQNVKSRGCEGNGEAGWTDCRGQQSLPLGRFIEVNFVWLGMDDLELKRLKGVIAMGCVGEIDRMAGECAGERLTTEAQRHREESEPDLENR